MEEKEMHCVKEEVKTLERVAIELGYQKLCEDFVKYDFTFHVRKPEYQKGMIFPEWLSRIKPTMFDERRMVTLLANRGIGFEDVLRAITPGLLECFKELEAISMKDERGSDKDEAVRADNT